MNLSFSIKTQIILYIIFFEIIIINCQQYVPMGRNYHTAALVGTKIYFLGGQLSNNEFTNEFFYLDVSKPFDKTKGSLPFVNLSDKSSSIPAHSKAVTSIGGKLRDSIFMFGGMRVFEDPYDPFKFLYSFNTTQQEWEAITVVSNEKIPLRRRSMNAVTDNDGKMFVFGGGIDLVNSKGITNTLQSNDMDIFDTINKIWSEGTIENAPLPRDGHTGTFLSDTGEIVYIGGHGRHYGLIDMNNLDVYNTITNSWTKLATKNAPEKRFAHTAVLTNDKRIIIFGGTTHKLITPVKNHYVVLDLNTLEWYLGKNHLSTGVPFIGHTATLINNYMFIAFGTVDSVTNKINDDIFIYKVGDYANFTELTYFMNENTTNTTNNNNNNDNNDNNATQTPTDKGGPNRDNIVVLGATLCSIIGLVIIVFIVFTIHKKYKRSNTIIPV